MSKKSKGKESTKAGSQVIYTGVFLTPAGRAELLRHVPVLPEHVNEFAHHMTIWFHRNPSIPIEDLPVGETVQLSVLGYTSDSSAVAAVIDAPPELKVANKFPHITVATAEGVKPFHSNHLLETKGIETQLHGVVVEGRVGWFDGRNARFELL